MNICKSGSLRMGAAMLVLGAALLGACGQDTPEALFKSAKEYLAKKDYKAASIQLRNLLEKQPENGEARYLLAVSMIEAGDYASAEKELRRAIEYRYSPDTVYPELSKVMLSLGDFKKLVAELGNMSVVNPAAQASIKVAVGEAYFALGQRNKAREAFSAALASVPGDPRARVGEARIIAAEGAVPDAMKITDEILAKSPALPEALALKADLLISQAKPEEAVTVLSSLVKAAPYNGQAHFALVSLLIAGNRFDQAASGIEAMKKAIPRDIRWRYLEAMLAFRQNEPAKARDAIRQVLKVVPDHGPSLLLAGAVEFQLGSLATAEDYLRKVLATYPSNLYARNLLVTTYLRKGQPQKAEDALAPALKFAPKDQTILRTAGEVAFANNQLADATKYFEQALTQEKDSTQLRTRLAQVRLARGETERALQDLETVSVLDKTQYQADLSLITAYLNRKNYDKALAAVAALEKKQPANALTYNVKGIVYISMRDFKNARVSFEKALSLQFNYLSAAQNLAKLDLLDKNPDAAKKRFEAILAKEPNNDSALLALAQTQISIFAPPSEIKATLDRAVRVGPSSVAARVALINFLAQNGDPKAALNAAQTADAAMPNEPRILDALGQAQMATGDTNQAIATFNKLASALPESPAPLMRLASAQYGAKRFDAAIQVLRKALVIKPDLLEAQREIIVVQLAAGQVEEALKEARAIQKAKPQEAIGFAMEGDVLASQKKLAEGARAYAEATRRRPVPALVVRHHQLLQAAGESAEAGAVAAKWLKENPKDPVFRFYMAETARQSNNYADAVKRYREILAQQPENAAVLNNLAWVLNELKDPTALGYAEKAYSIAPTNPAIQDTYGWMLFNKGDTKRGIDLLTQAVRGAPKAVEVRMHLAKALLKAGDKAGAKRELEAVGQFGEKTPLKAEADQLLKSL